jgi:hypothetical protein
MVGGVRKSVIAAVAVLAGFGCARADRPHDAAHPVDAALVDGGAIDVGADSGPRDTGVHDAGPADVGAMDAGAADGGHDAGTIDASAMDAGRDASFDGGHDATAMDAFVVPDSGIVTATWSTSASGLPCTVGARTIFRCPPGGTPSSLWGTGEYTSDSSLCTAAVHAGHITLVSGGDVTIEMRAGRSAYVGSMRHGITSSAYGTYACSYAVVAPACTAGTDCSGLCVDTTSDHDSCGTCGHACAATEVCSGSACTCAPGLAPCGGACVDLATDPMHCGSCTTACGAGEACAAMICGGRPATWSLNATDHDCSAAGVIGSAFTYACPPGGTAGSAWGTDLYTHDSSICTAAAHVGRITTAAGGAVTIVMQPGASAYPGSTRNGITTSTWGAWSCSYSVM